MIRLRSRIQATWPATPIGVYLADFGHQRTGNERADVDERNAWFLQLFDHYLLGKGPRPGLGFRARAVTCPVGNGSGPLHSAPTWAQLHPGEVRYRAPTTPRRSRRSVAIRLVGLDFHPLSANDPCRTVPAADAAGTATYRLPAATGDGYTLLGAPTVIAQLDVTGVNAQVAAPGCGTSRPTDASCWSTREVLRPRANGKPEPFQLQPAGWHVAPGHVVKLELLGSDAPHYRPSNGIFTIAVRDLELRLPVAERPDGGRVAAPAPPLMPDGAKAAADLPPPRRLAARVTYPELPHRADHRHRSRHPGSQRRRPTRRAPPVHAARATPRRHPERACRLRREPRRHCASASALLQCAHAPPRRAESLARAARPRHGGRRRLRLPQRRRARALPPHLPRQLQRSLGAADARRQAPAQPQYSTWKKGYAETGQVTVYSLRRVGSAMRFNLSACRSDGDREVTIHERFRVTWPVRKVARRWFLDRGVKVTRTSRGEVQRWPLPLP